MPDDPRIAAIAAEAQILWQSALDATAAPAHFTIAVAPLPAGVLATTTATTWNGQGQPTGGLITLSPDADGHGWFVDQTPEQNGAFSELSGSQSLIASASSPAFGHYDLLTTLLHEIAHLEGFMPDNPVFEQFVHTVGSTQTWNGAGVTASLVDADQELDPAAYPDDLLSATLAPSTRELPSALDVQILNAVVVHVSPAPTRTIPVTTVVDHAIAAVGSTRLHRATIR